MVGQLAGLLSPPVFFYAGGAHGTGRPCVYSALSPPKDKSTGADTVNLCPDPLPARRPQGA